jgi:hypothetical protein
MQSVASDHGCDHNAGDRQQQYRRQVFSQVSNVNIDAGFEQQCGQEQDEDDVRCQQLRLFPLAQDSRYR